MPAKQITTKKMTPRDWEAMALDCLHAVRLMDAHYTDLSKSNPGFMGKLVLQRYGVWNAAMLSSSRVLQKYAHIPTTQI